MATIDEEFRATVREAQLEEDFAQQLANAARTVAASGSMANAISSMRTIPASQLRSIEALAHRLAHRYGLDVTVETDPMCRVRFARRDQRG